MGIVYQAQQAVVDRAVAIKVMTPGHGSISVEREIHALCRLRHPLIAALYEAGWDFRLGMFLVMELIDGALLEDWVATECPTYYDRLAMLVLIAEAVAYAHSDCVVHLDLKPANIFITRSGVPKILDFGLAQVVDVTPVPGATEEAHSCAGTFAFMSPEQTVGQSPRGPASDVYSLGCIMYVLLTGRLPIALPEDGSPDTFERIRHVRPDPPHLNRDLNAIILKCLAKDPSDRYPTAGELHADLHRMMRQFPVYARPQRPLYVVSKWCLRHGRMIAASASMSLLVSACAWRIVQSHNDAAIAVLSTGTVAEGSCWRGDALFDAGNYGAALDQYEICCRHRRVALGPDHSFLLLTQHKVGRTLRAVGRFEEALSQLARVRDEFAKKLGPSAPEVAVCLIDLGDVYARLHTGSIPQEYIEAERILAAHTQTHAEPLVQVQMAIAHRLREIGALDEAEFWARKGVRTATAWTSPAQGQCAAAQTALATVLAARGKYASARALIQESLSSVQGLAVYTDLLRALAGIAWLDGDYRDAETHLRECLLIDATSTWRRMWAMNSLAVVLRSQGRYDEAIEHHMRAREIAQQVSPHDSGLLEQLERNRMRTEQEWHCRLCRMDLQRFPFQ